MATVGSIRTKIKDDKYGRASLTYGEKPFKEISSEDFDLLGAVLDDYTFDKFTPETFKIIEKEFSDLKNYVKLTPKCAHLTCINCSDDNTYEEWKTVRQLWRQDKGIIIHHFYQSFPDEDNITSEFAHKIGVQFAERCFEGFQVAVMTHVDSKHIHNHIYVNSCNLITGKKWHDNKSTLQYLRNQSDLICIANNLSVLKSDVKDTDNLSSTSFRVAENAASWKLPIVNALDEVLEFAKTKEQFITEMNKRGFSINYRDTYITIIDKDNNRVRVNNLARQFGERYYKDNIDKVLGVTISGEYKPHASNASKDLEEVIKDSKKKCRPYTGVEFSQKAGNNEFYAQLAEREFSPTNRLIDEISIVAMQRKRAFNSTASTAVINAHSPKFTAKIILYLLLSVKLASLKLAKKFTALNDKYKVFQKKDKFMSYKMYRNPSANTKSHSSKVIGNINRNVLIQSAGDNYTVLVDALELRKLVNAPIYYSAKLTDNGKATITIKVDNKEKLEKLLDTQIITDNRTVAERKRDKLAKIRRKEAYDKNNKAYEELKGCKDRLRSDIITPEERERLEKTELTVAYARLKNKTGQFRILYKASDAEKVYTSIYPGKKINSKLGELDSQSLKDIARQYSTSVTYKIITRDELMKLRESPENIMSALYYKPETDKYNLAYLSHDKEKINDILYMEERIKENCVTSIENMRQFASAIRRRNSEPVKMKNVSARQINAVIKSKLNAAFMESNEQGKYYLIFDKTDEVRMNMVLKTGKTMITDNSLPMTQVSPTL